MTESSERTTFFGIPVTGSVIRAAEETPQRPKEEFAPLLQAVLDRPEIQAVRWNQYTPYFNDGDPCVFGAYGVEVKFAEGPESPADDSERDPSPFDGDDDESGWVDCYMISRTEWLDTLGPDGRRERVREPEAEYADRADAVVALVALEEAIESDAFDRVLLDAFGDHARVTVTKTEINVEAYSHD